MLLIVSIAAALVYFLYYKNLQSNELSKTKILVLTLIRFIALIFIGFLLLSPLIKVISRETKKPIIVFAQDNSVSMLLSKDSSFIRDSFPQLLNSIKSRFSENYEVVTLQFGDSIRTNSASFTDKETNFETLFNEFNTTYFNQNIGALIIASDGLYNKGTQPIYAAQQLSFPIYTIPFGDTLENIDLSVSKIEYNSVVYKGSNFPVKVGVAANLMKGQDAIIEISNKGKVIATQKLTISSNNFYKNILFYLNADSAGVFSYNIQSKSPVTETNIYNNSKTIYIEVEDAKRKVLLLQNGYHPDVAVFKRILDRNPAFEIEIKTITDFKGSIDEYALIILHQLPSDRNNLQNIWPQIQKAEIPLLFVLGNETSVALLNGLNLQFKLNQKNKLNDDVLPHLNQEFNLFNHAIENHLLHTFSPLNVPFGEYTMFLNNQILMYQKMGQIETQKPLWAFTEAGNQKLGYIMGEGLWKWNLNEFKAFRDHSITDELVIKTIQYLALKQRMNPFIIEYSKTYAENQEVVLHAKFLNASNEFVKGATINFTLIDEKGNTYLHTFKESVDDYVLNLGMMGVGNYNFEASTLSINKTLKYSGIFIVKENLIEQSNLIADHNMLYKLALNSKGLQVEKNNINELISHIENNSEIATVEYTQKTFKDLIHLKILLIILILLFATEWFLRKMWGVV
jgi:hypothetical protein